MQDMPVVKDSMMDIISLTEQSVESKWEMICNHTFAIYGIGFVAGWVTSLMENRGWDGQIRCYIVSEGEKNSVSWKTKKPVVSVDSYIPEENEIIVIAVHEAILPEIIDVLDRYGLRKRLWIRPMDIEVMGYKSKKKMVQTTELYKNRIHEYSIEIRYLAIENFYGLSDDGYEIYLEVLEKDINRNTAVARLEKFKKLIESYESSGYDEDKPIWVDKDGYLLDGAHRLALALFHKQNEVPCICFEMRAERLLPVLQRITQHESQLMNLGLKNNQIKKLVETKRALSEAWIEKR